MTDNRIASVTELVTSLLTALTLISASEKKGANEYLTNKVNQNRIKHRHVKESSGIAGTYYLENADMLRKCFFKKMVKY